MTIDPVTLNALMLGMVALVQALTAYITNSLAAKRSDKVANQLATTTTKQEIKLDAIASVADKTHKLVNSKMGEVLTALVVSAQALYNLDSSEANGELLRVAEKNLKEHKERQQEADKQISDEDTRCQ